MKTKIIIYLAVISLALFAGAGVASAAPLRSNGNPIGGLRGPGAIISVVVKNFEHTF